MKVLTFSKQFQKGHPKAGQPTFFVEKVMACLADRIPNWTMYDSFVQYDWYAYYNCTMPKGHTIRAGNRFKPGDMASLRIWSGLPYRSKQIEFAQVEVKKTWDIEINNRFGAASLEVVINGVIYGQLHYGYDKNVNEAGLVELSKNDGLELRDFIDWFEMHPKKTGLRFAGQIICWSPSVNYP
jgi:hypothetical protein